MENITNPKVLFWKRGWENLINNFNKNTSGLKLYTPHTLVDDLIIEILENKLRNQENKKYFQAKVKFVLKNDKIITKHLISEFRLLDRELHEGNINYLLCILNDLKKFFSTGEYFVKNFELLKDELYATNELTLGQQILIENCCQNLIVEFIKKGYILEDILNFPKYLFENYTLRENNIYTSFPYPKELSSNTLDRIDKIKAYIDSLNEQERLNGLLTYFTKQKEIVTYIFKLEGILGNIDLPHEGVSFYDVDTKRIVSPDDPHKDYEILPQWDTNKKFPQVSVQVEYLMAKSNLLDALNKLDNCLDIISLNHNLKTKLTINYSTFLVVNSQGNIIHYSNSVIEDNNFYKYFESVDLNESSPEYIDSLKTRSKLLIDSSYKNPLRQRLINSIHWFRKAEESQKAEDKLLNFWISIESLIPENSELFKRNLKKDTYSKFHLIQKVVADNSLFRTLYSQAWELFYEFDYILNFPFISQQVIKEMPAELKVKSQLNGNYFDTREVKLIEFIKGLPDLRSFVIDSSLISKIDEVYKCYCENKSCKEHIENIVKQIEEDLLMIYRYRNLIVHNAFIDNNLVSEYVIKIKMYSKHIIETFLDDFLLNDSYHDNIVMNIFMKKDNYLLRFKNLEYTIIS